MNALAPLPGVIGSTIITHGGTYFDFRAPERSTITIEDIAWGLSNTCRFGGHTDGFYSVAQHSVIVSRHVPPEDAMAALLHDGAEAYVGDVPSPLKQLLPEFKAIEKAAEAAIFAHFGLELPMPASVKIADLRALATEKRDLINGSDTWPGMERYTPFPETITPMMPQLAYGFFMYRFRELGGVA